MKYLFLILLFTISCGSKPLWAQCTETCADIGRGFEKINNNGVCVCSLTGDEMIQEQLEQFHRMGY